MAAAVVIVRKRGCQLQRMSDPPVNHRERESHRLHWLGQEGAGQGGVGHRSLGTRPSQEKHCQSSSAGALGRKPPARALSCGLCWGELAWGFPGQEGRQPGHRKVVPLWALAQEVAFTECLLCADTEEEQLIQIRQPWEQGLESSWQEKQLLITCGFPEAPQASASRYEERGLWGFFPCNPHPTHGSIWESRQPRDE